MSLPQIYPFHPSHFGGGATSPQSGPLAEPNLSYTPPYTRAVDDQIAWFLVRHLHPLATVDHAVSVGPQSASLRLDFLVSRGRQKVGFTASESSDVVDVQQESYQKSLVVASGKVDSIYSFYGPRLEERVADCLSVVAGWHPSLFSADGLASLSGRATRISRSFSLHGTGSEVRLHYQHASLEDQYGGERFVWPDEEPEQVIVRRFGVVRSIRARPQSRRRVA